MTLNILDVVIVLIILMGGIIGMKRGVIKQGVMTIGMILVIVFSFILKNPVSALMYKNLPFISFGGLLENLTILNILLYEVIAFALVFGILSAILMILIKISSIFEKILKFTIILAIPSKILGFILGIVEYYLVVFIILFVLSSPTFQTEKFDFINESKLKPIILNNTLGLTDMLDGTLDTFDEVNNLIKDKEKYSDKEFNCRALNIMIKNKFLDQESADYLNSKDKINLNCKGE